MTVVSQDVIEEVFVLTALWLYIVGGTLCFFVILVVIENNIDNSLQHTLI